VKVIAIDERSGTEVSLVGDPSRSSDYLKRIGMQKLQRVMERKGKPPTS
jgi:hypothetical protein